MIEIDLDRQQELVSQPKHDRFNPTMHEVYRNIDTAKVGMIDELLKQSGIPTILKNFTGGSNITSIPIPSLYPTIYVLDASQVAEAKEQIHAFFSAKPANDAEWTCNHCGETVDSYLSECWSCQQPREPTLKA